MIDQKVSKDIKPFMNSLYGITERQWKELSFQMERSFERKHRDFQKECRINGEDDLVWL